MQNSALDPQDQRERLGQGKAVRGKKRKEEYNEVTMITSCVEDSTAMTIEFLRARLLSERSISKSARQRADELAKKVMELEEQLRTVILQRKMAEKATADVLAILENQGISDVSEEFDSGSDLENPCDSSMSNECAKEDEGRMSSKGRQHGSDEMSGSNVDSSPVSSKSLSWKGRHDSPYSLEKYKTSNLRRQSSFSSLSSSPKHRLGKSCRKIRHRQNRSVVEESRDKSVKVNCQDNELASSSEGFPNFSDGGSNIPKIESKIQEEDGSEANLLNKNHHIDGYGREKDMEKALEHQAQLIYQYEAMEKAQREWEEKFRENNSTTPDSCDPGNHSDMTEDKDESKVQIPYAAKVVTSNAEERKGEPSGIFLSEEKFKAEARDIMPKTYDTGGYSNQKSTTFSTSDLLGQENSHSPLKGNQNESSVNGHLQSSDMNHQDPGRHGHPDSQPTYSFQADILGVQRQNDASRNNNDLSALVTHEQSHKFNGVLESLKQARISLKQELDRLPLVEGGYTAKPSASFSRSEDRFEVPVGCSGLFRLPTDFSDGATARFNVRDPTAGFGSNFHLNRGISRTSGGQFFTSPPLSRHNVELVC
ncbi:micronuclear linker histone polyprotein isoform X1 [Spatholobus suberectus]|nr:micronuclear linker histone polyprotein isoform X1 [Spatholobus suberectus]